MGLNTPRRAERVTGWQFALLASSLQRLSNCSHLGITDLNDVCGRKFVRRRLSRCQARQTREAWTRRYGGCVSDPIHSARTTRQQR